MSGVELKLSFANDSSPRTPEEKEAIINKAAKAYEAYMDALGFDWRNDPNSADTPRRVAKAFVNDLAAGCYDAPPNITAFDNIDSYDGVVCQNNIPMISMCAHHHASFTGIAHVAYIPSRNGKIIGLSKLNRIVDWFSRRPSVQESLTENVCKYINDICERNKGVAVMVEAKHTCCSSRGIKHNSTMRTAKMTGSFLDDNDNSRAEFYKFVELAHMEKVL